ncbi:hypothetical protein LguiB_000050 [Lonicera macranthoides]
MDHNALKERDHVVDIDVGGTGCEEDTNDGPVSSNKGSKRMLNKLKTGALCVDGATKGECRVNHNNLGNSTHENTELSIDNKNTGGQNGEHMPLLEKKQVKEKTKTMSCKKASKPPRPPKGPSLCTTDLMLLREMSELAMKKRARIEHIKALKKRRALRSSSSSSSSNSSIPAMVITLLFCLVIFFQGICSRNNTTMNFAGSPEPAAAGNSLISVQLYNTQPPTDCSEPSSVSPKIQIPRVMMVQLMKVAEGSSSRSSATKKKLTDNRLVSVDERVAKLNGNSVPKGGTSLHTQQIIAMFCDIKSTSFPVAKSCLTACSFYYKSTVAVLPNAVRDFESGRYSKAIEAR